MSNMPIQKGDKHGHQSNRRQSHHLHAMQTCFCSRCRAAHDDGGKRQRENLCKADSSASVACHRAKMAEIFRAEAKRASVIGLLGIFVARHNCVHVVTAAADEIRGCMNFNQDAEDDEEDATVSLWNSNHFW
jgi:hypothetical protein